MASLANQRETYARKSEHLEIPENSFSEFQVKNIDKIHERANARVSLRQSGKGFDSFAPSLQVFAITAGVTSRSGVEAKRNGDADGSKTRHDVNA